MTDPITPLPQGASTYSTIREYQNQCEQFAERLGKGPLDWENNAFVMNRTSGDKKFQLLYNDPKKDFFCSAQINWFDRSVEVKAGLGKNLKDKFAGFTRKTKGEVLGSRKGIPDACTLTQEFVGGQEFAGQTCQDSLLDPRLENLELYHSARLFLDRANQIQSETTILGTHAQVTADQIRMIDDVQGDGIFRLLYQNPVDNIFIEGIFDSTRHAIVLRHGMLHEYEDKEPTELIQMTDACSITSGLLGEEELVGKCTDKTKTERDREYSIQHFAYPLGSAASLYLGYRVAKRYLGRSVAASGLPVYKHLASAYFAAAGYDTLAGIFLPEDHPARIYGAWTAGAMGLIWPKQFWGGIAGIVPQSIRAGIATRIAARTSGTLVGSVVGGGVRGIARTGGRLAAGVALVPIVNYGWRKWITGSDYQASVNKRVADQVYDDDDVYDFEWSDLFPLKGGLKLVRGGARWLAPDMMNSGIAYDNDDLEDKIKKEDQEAAAEAAAFISEVLPPLLTHAEGKDPQTTIALLRDEPIELNKTEEEVSEFLFKEGPVATAEKYQLMPDKIEDLAYRALLKKIQEAAAWLVFVPGDNNKWAKEVFNRNGTLKSEFDDDALNATGRQPYENLKERFPYEPEPDEFWVDLITGEKIPAFESPPPSCKASIVPW